MTQCTCKSSLSSNEWFNISSDTELLSLILEDSGPCQRCVVY